MQCTMLPFEESLILPIQEMNNGQHVSRVPSLNERDKPKTLVDRVYVKDALIGTAGMLLILQVWVQTPQTIQARYTQMRLSL